MVETLWPFVEEIHLGVEAAVAYDKGLGEVILCAAADVRLGMVAMVVLLSPVRRELQVASVHCREAMELLLL